MENNYTDIIDNMVATAINQTKNFYEIINILPGIHPIEIFAALTRLFANNKIDKNGYTALKQSAMDLPQNDACQDSKKLPVPHQVDYDWRFNQNGKNYFVNYIDNWISNNSESAARIAFIGSPTLFIHYCTEAKGVDGIFLIDFNAAKHTSKLSLPAYAHIVNCNLNYDLDSELRVDEICADLIVFDPPWYPEYYKKFFDISNIVGNEKCTVLGVFPPILTRNTVVSERQEINEYIRLLGFSKLEFKPLTIEYYTPPFEKNVLHSHNIFNFPTSWRKGDFFFTERKSTNYIPENRDCIIVKNGGWTEKNIDIVRFKLRQSDISEDCDFQIRLDSLYKNDIYPSVSRRFKGHEKINVWTSGNRVFYCSNIPVLFLIMERLYDENIIATLEDDYGEMIPDTQKDQIKKVQKHVQFVVQTELEEYGEWYD